MKEGALAIMQPYIFPYLGYFHLVQASSKFIFYDDVNFIKRGWVNRNRILLNGEAHMFSIPLVSASQNRMINEIETAIDKNFLVKMEQKLEHAYKKAPYFEDVKAIVLSTFSSEHTSIGELAIKSVISVYDYLGIELVYGISSKTHSESQGVDRADRLITMTKKEGFSHYINAAGGTELYTKPYFKEAGLDLSFIESLPCEYQQHTSNFVPWLSIIDVLMFNDVPSVLELIGNYRVS